MDKAILKKFAIESRQDLMSKIKNKINTYYIDEEFTKEQKGDLYILSNSKHSLSLTNEEYKKRELLIKRIKELSLEQVIEEAAYTWFNRIIAIRYMEINDMLPLTRDNQSLGIRVLSSKDNTPDPEILKFTNLMNPELDIEFKKEKFAELKDDNEKFKYILLLVCKKLGRVIPQVFDGITDYIDILIPDNLLNDTGFIAKIINEVPEENYNQVEIIGWLYQYYNQTEKDRVISAKKAYKKNEIAYATQLFTPDWIVKYMVDNTLGKYSIENGNKINNGELKYLIEKEELENKDIIKLEEISFIDPCCGSGHILVYAFELFFKLYVNQGYNKNKISELILTNNLFGIDIDDRACQLSILSVLLKAREYDKNIFNCSIVKNLNILSMQDSIGLNETTIESIQNNSNRELAKELVEIFKNAKTYGSLIKTDKKNYEELENEIYNDYTIFGIELREKLIPLIKQAKLLSRKYNIVVTNPPYMNNSYMNPILKEFISKNYYSVKSDLFSAFVVRNNSFCKKNGYMGFMTPYVWMFIGTYQDLREYILNNNNIDSLIQLEYSALEEATVPICSFVLKNTDEDESGKYIRLTEYKGGMKIQEEKYNEIVKNKSYYIKSKNQLNNLPNKIIAYWITERMEQCFKNIEIGNLIPVKKGADTGDNNKYLRQWYELEFKNIKLFAKPDEKFVEKWVPYNKGGEYHKWYGNNDIVINWENDGFELKNSKANLRSQHLYFKDAITWSALTSANTSFRYSDYGAIFDSAGSSMFPSENIYYYLALCNSVVSKKILDMINPTLNFGAGSIAKIPVIFDKLDEVQKLAESNVTLCKEDWNSFETSWDFVTHPLIEYKSGAGYEEDIEKWNFRVKDAFNTWKENCNKKFELLKNNEEELNRIFIDIYDLQDELDSKVDEKDITIRKADKEREIKSLISYAVGCMFGRYSLDKEGLVYAGGEFNSNIYKTYKADIDNIIPITDESYFGDDIVERFKKFIEVVYGNETLNENLEFIAETLGKKGTETSEDTIRRYFVTEFFNDHVKMYQKRPIYWLFDSGKKNGFKALVYMHRYNENLIPKIRLDYLHRIQTTYEKLLSDVNYKLTTELSMSDKKAVQNKQVDLNAKLQEIKEYDEKIAHIANQRISIDLDDGVKENYDKFKDILAKIK